MTLMTRTIDQYVEDDLPNAKSRIEEEHELEEGIVIGFDAAGPIHIRSLDPKGGTTTHCPAFPVENCSIW